MQVHVCVCTTAVIGQPKCADAFQSAKLVNLCQRHCTKLFWMSIVVLIVVVVVSLFFVVHLKDCKTVSSDIET